MAFRLGNELAYGARRALLGAPQQFRRYSQQVEQVLSTEKEEVGSKGRGLFFSGSFAGTLIYMFWARWQQFKIDKLGENLDDDLFVDIYRQIHNVGKQSQNE
ncbi:hypothetical protein P3S67_011421 [Capsicum chacoense]